MNRGNYVRRQQFGVMRHNYNNIPRPHFVNRHNNFVQRGHSTFFPRNNPRCNVMQQ